MDEEGFDYSHKDTRNVKSYKAPRLAKGTHNVKVDYLRYLAIQKRMTQAAEAHHKMIMSYHSTTIADKSDKKDRKAVAHEAKVEETQRNLRREKKKIDSLHRKLNNATLDRHPLERNVKNGKHSQTNVARFESNHMTVL